MGVAEIGARIFYKIRWGQLYPLQSMEYSLRLGWRLAPGQHRDFTVNSAGFRGETEVSLRAEPGTLRMFLVGGSAAFGTNGLYAQFPAEPIRQETIDYHLQRLLEEHYPGRSIEVINAAVPEYRLNQETTLYSEKLLNYSPDLVVFFDGHNDISYLSGADVDTAVPGLWNARHIRRGERALNARSVFNLSLILDIYLGRSSYAYHMLATVMQKVADRRGVSGEHPWGTRSFTLADEAAFASTTPHLDSAAVKYVDQVRYLAAMADQRDPFDRLRIAAPDRGRGFNASHGHGAAHPGVRIRASP